MTGWLEFFARLGLIEWERTGEKLELVRDPSADELASASR